jgi:hypothetical protein
MAVTSCGCSRLVLKPHTITSCRMGQGGIMCKGAGGMVVRAARLHGVQLPCKAGPAGRSGAGMHPPAANTPATAYASPHPQLAGTHAQQLVDGRHLQGMWGVGGII